MCHVVQTLQVGEGSAIPMAGTKSTLPFSKFWDEDEEEEKEVVSGPMMGTREPNFTEDPFPIMEDIFGDLHLKSHQTSTASLEATTKEIIIDIAHKGAEHVELVLE